MDLGLFTGLYMVTFIVIVLPVTLFACVVSYIQPRLCDSNLICYTV